MYCAENGIPCIWTSGCPTAGTTSPVFPAGSLVVALAEFLAGLVVAQLTRPGSPIVVGSAFGALDMATGLRPYAAPEQDLGQTSDPGTLVVAGQLLENRGRWGALRTGQEPTRRHQSHCRGGVGKS